MERAAGYEVAPYRWHGCWQLDKREALARCQWLIVYERLTPAEFHGIVSGYSGGGAFEYEEFFVHLDGVKIASCVIDGIDRATGKSLTMAAALGLRERRRHSKLDFCAIFEEFNYGWNCDVQYLASNAIGKFDLMALDEDEEFPNEIDLIGGTASASWVKHMLGDYFWTTAAPSVLQSRMSQKERAARQTLARSWMPKLRQREVSLTRLWGRRAVTRK